MKQALIVIVVLVVIVPAAAAPRKQRALQAPRAPWRLRRTATRFPPEVGAPSRLGWRHRSGPPEWSASDYLLKRRQNEPSRTCRGRAARNPGPRDRCRRIALGWGAESTMWP